ncbi:MAG: Zn-dependent hydrolase [Bacillus sp. (in: Bacteria)]|nr:Zn-dependent hydrolase [Bacillus sp. (in: firmicutes)]
MKINIQRLLSNIEVLGKIGLNKHGGLDRTTFTDAELMAREWLRQKLKGQQLEVRLDEAANIWGRRPGKQNSLPVITFGSHIDTVPNGGKYDGALGVLMALEVMEVLNENNFTTEHPLELVSFSAEEPNPFGLSTFGSRAITGKLMSQDVQGVKNPDGLLVTDALAKAGGNPDTFDNAVRTPEELAAFLEVHIEQGKRLLTRNIPVGVVTAITGIYREVVTVHGEANHAGTTLMNDRKDALTAASELILALESVCRAHPAEEVVGTIGRIVVQPNAANIIPKQVQLSLEIRGKTNKEIKEVLAQWEKELESIIFTRDVQVDRKVMLDQAPSPMDETVMETIEEASQQLGYESYRLGSMAGHDATHMATITKSGMIFVPSIDGISHCPEEESRVEDIEKVANVLLHSILSLDKKLTKGEETLKQ